MPLNNPYRKLTTELKLLKAQLSNKIITPGEAESVLNELIKDFENIEHQELSINQEELVKVFFPEFKLI